MARKRYRADQIIHKLREAEVALAHGNRPRRFAEAGITEQTLCRWSREYGGLKRLLAEAELDKAMLREAASGNF